MQLTAELNQISNGEGPKAEKAKNWLARFEPLEAVIVERISEWIPKLAYPIRLGTHNQSAFAFGLFIDWSRTSGNSSFEKLISDKALDFAFLLA